MNDFSARYPNKTPRALPPVAAKTVGLGLVALGVLLLLAVFALAYREYANIAPTGGLEEAVGVLVWAVVKAVFLGVMGWVGAIMVARGIDALQEQEEVEEEWRETQARYR